MISYKKLENETIDLRLSKWAGLLVTGDHITKEQALEIMIRTDLLYNSFRFEKSYSDSLFKMIKKTYVSFPSPEDQISDVGVEIDRYYKIFGVISLNYLNNQKISFDGGLYGWVNENGKVFSNNYNIGKNATFSSLINDIKLILESFDFIKNINFQFLNKEFLGINKNVILTIKVINREIYYSLEDRDLICEISNETVDDFIDHREDINHIKMIKKGLMICGEKFSNE